MPYFMIFSLYFANIAMCGPASLHDHLFLKFMLFQKETHDVQLDDSEVFPPPKQDESAANNTA